MADSSDEISLDSFRYTDFKKRLDSIKQIVIDLHHDGNKELSISSLLMECNQMLYDAKNALESLEKRCYTSSFIVTNLISYQKGVIASFNHCSDSNIIYRDSDFILIFKTRLTDLFKNATDVQTLFFSILEKVKFDLTLNEDQHLLINVLQHIWYGAKAVYKASKTIMTTNWKLYITMSQKYSTELKGNIINDEPIDFLCKEIKTKISSFQHDDEATLKLTTYMISALVKLCSYGCVLTSHNELIELIIFLNSYWLSDTQDAVIIKNRLSQFVEQLVLVSDETFAKVFQSSCQDLINNSSPSRKISALYIAMLLLKRLTKTPCDLLANEIISIVFQLIGRIDSIMCYFNIEIYQPLLINLASLILVSDYQLFENVENILIKNILNTEYWPAIFSSDLWIIIMRYLPPDLRNTQFMKLARIFEELSVFPCFVQCPQHIYLEILLRRHYNLLANKNQLVNICPQIKTESLQSAIGTLYVPTLMKYNRLSEMTKMLTVLPYQKNYEHLNGDITHLWNCLEDEYPSNFICALIEVTTGSEARLRTILPKTNKILSGYTDEDTIEMKRCRLRLIRSIFLHGPTPIYQENLIMKIFLKYLFDHHPMVRQWTVETIVYFSSITRNQNNLISMLFQRPEIRVIITDYIEMKTNNTYSHDDKIKYFEQLAQCGKFYHKCSSNGQLNKMLDKLKSNLDCINDIVSKTQMSVDESERLKEYSSLLNNICESMQLNIENV